MTNDLIVLVILDAMCLCLCHPITQIRTSRNLDWLLTKKNAIHHQKPQKKQHRAHNCKTMRPFEASSPIQTKLQPPTTTQQVRTKFFHQMIGIDSGSPTTPTKPAALEGTTKEALPIATPSPNWVHPQTLKVNRSKQALKYDRNDDKIYCCKRRRVDPAAGNSAKRRKSITFDDSVDVLPIPMRSEYSNRVRERLWSNGGEIYQNAARNAIEFASEG